MPRRTRLRGSGMARVIPTLSIQRDVRFGSPTVFSTHTVAVQRVEAVAMRLGPPPPLRSGTM